MLLLTFRIGNDRYAIDTADLVELVPLVRLRKLPSSPRGVAGLLDYHGTLIPAVDLSLLATGKPARAVMSTRIAIVRYDANEEEVLFAVILENAVGTIRRVLADFAPPGIAVPDAPYLGEVAHDDGGTIQQIEVRYLLPDELRERLLPRVSRRMGLES